MKLSDLRLNGSELTIDPALPVLEFSRKMVTVDVDFEEPGRLQTAVDIHSMDNLHAAYLKLLDNLQEEARRISVELGKLFFGGSGKNVFVKIYIGESEPYAVSYYNEADETIREVGNSSEEIGIQISSSDDTMCNVEVIYKRKPYELPEDDTSRQWHDRNLFYDFDWNRNNLPEGSMEKARRIITDMFIHFDAFNLFKVIYTKRQIPIECINISRDDEYWN